MKFQYVGVGKDDPKTTKVYGYEFELGGAAVDVTDEKVIAKLKANGTFKAVEGADVNPKSQPPAAPVKAEKPAPSGKVKAA